MEMELHKAISSSQEYQSFAKRDLPSYIQDNLSKTLRDYQVEAIKRMIYSYEYNGLPDSKHLMFNMATGTGKTLVMAANMLYLYEKGYRNFVFFVNSVNILNQARSVLTDSSYDKYLFKSSVSFNGRNVNVRTVNSFSESNDNDINILFTTIHLLSRHIEEGGENRVTVDSFKDSNVVMLADEAHHLSAGTKNKKDIKHKATWEGAVMSVLDINPKNILLEFTATVELKNPSVYKKYQDKLLYKYDFIQFNKAGYSKNVEFLYNKETNIENQKRRLIINAVVLSEYRKVLFENMNADHINPVILIKSKKIADSKTDRQFFDSVIQNLAVGDLDHLVRVEGTEKRITNSLLAFFKRYSKEEFIYRIKQSFTIDHTIIYNSQQKQNIDTLRSIDNQPKGTKVVRAIFAVDALNEGWDVLSLYDIVHFDIGENKKVSLRDIQLIGRGARYCPFEIDEKDNLFNKYGDDTYKRKFDDAPEDKNKVLDFFFYHFVETNVFLEELKKALKGEGIMDDEPQFVSIEMKEGFTQSNTYKQGFVLINGTEERKSVAKNERDAVLDKPIHARLYTLTHRSLTDEENTEKTKGMHHEPIVLNYEYEFENYLVKKALVQAENGFFYFHNLKKHITDIESIDEFIERYLSQYKIDYTYEKGHEIYNLSPTQKLNLLVSDGGILSQVRRLIEDGLPRQKGSRIFRPIPLKSVFSNRKTFSAENETATPQTNHERLDLRLDISQLEWYAYNESYGTDQEKSFVRYVYSHIDEVYEKYKGCEIFLVRNELDYHIYGIENGTRFSPDFLLFISDWDNKKLYYQCIFEPKGLHLANGDKWKEDFLLSLENIGKTSFEYKDGDTHQYIQYLEEVSDMHFNDVQLTGFAFYNSNKSKLRTFDEQFKEKLL